MFTPEDIKAVRAGTADRRTVLAVLTSQTCGEPCWMASEEVCRCSCGGRNHGCLSHGGKRPERTSRIDGVLYRFRAVGAYADLSPLAREINRLAGYRAIERPALVVDGLCVEDAPTPETMARLRAAGNEVWIHQYSYFWRDTDSGAPARMKTASATQRKWTELQGWQDAREVYLLWERVGEIEKPSILLLDKETGLPKQDQLPKAA